MWTTLKLLWGRPRRAYLNWFRKDYVRRSIARRRGECRRCGACCRMAFRCVYLNYDENGISSCSIYTRRWTPNCHTFPIDERDISDRNLTMPEKPCGYSFVKEQK